MQTNRESETVKGTITRLVDAQQRGSIAGEDAHEYVFSASALRDVAFNQLSLGAAVSFAPVHTQKTPRAEFVRLVQ